MVKILPRGGGKRLVVTRTISATGEHIVVQVTTLIIVTDEWVLVPTILAMDVKIRLKDNRIAKK